MGLHETSLFEPAKRRVEGPLLQVEEPVRELAQLLHDLEAILLLLGQEGE